MSCSCNKIIGVMLTMLFLLICIRGCTEVGVGAIKEIWDYRDGIGEELGELRDAFKEELGELFGAVSKNKLTEDKNLKGLRTLKSSNYIGEYNAKYNTFNGQEFIFGGTALQPEFPPDLEITYSLEIISGTAKLYILKSGKEHIVSGDRVQEDIANDTKSGAYQITLTDGDNFIVLEGNNFSGSLTVKCTYP